MNKKILYVLDQKIKNIMLLIFAVNYKIEYRNVKLWKII